MNICGMNKTVLTALFEEEQEHSEELGGELEDFKNEKNESSDFRKNRSTEGEEGTYLKDSKALLNRILCLIHCMFNIALT